MRPGQLFGSRLYGQIIWPLVLASIGVGIIATFVAVYFLNDLTSRWVSQVTENSTANLSIHLVDHANHLSDVAGLLANSRDLRDAVAADDPSLLRRTLERENEDLDYDAMMVVAPDGTVLAYRGLGTVEYGSAPFNGALGNGRQERTFFAQLSGREMLVAVESIGKGPAAPLIVLGLELDDEFLGDLGVAENAAACLYSSDGRDLACAVGSQVPTSAVNSLRAAIELPAPAIRQTLDRARGGKVPAGRLALDTVGYSLPENRYEVWTEEVKLPGETGPAGKGYLVGIVSQAVTHQAGRTTANLIMMWSIVAVVSLVGLGGWVARRVSDPLVALAAGAQRVADGDFETKIEVTGHNEIATLASTFNEMTDSLQERSESLTKKVLELATLYEMSRSLGSTLDLDELLESVLGSALRIFDLDLGHIGLRDKESGAVDIRAVRGRIRNNSDASLRSSMSEWVVREGRPLIFNPDTASAKQFDAVTGAKAALCVPLVSAEGTIGSITIGSSESHFRFTSDDVRLLSTIANQVTMAIGNIELFTSLQEAYLATVRSLAAAVDAKDSYTRGHSERVAMFATLMAERLGLGHEQRIALEMAAYLHDIGKIGVKEEILLKPGRLDDDEVVQMRHHPLIGANILKPVAFPWAITPVVRHHHEHYDGSGYPAGLRGEEIPLLARILTVADSFEAMTSDRPYRRGLSTEDALAELRRCSGSQFDPRLVDAFATIVDDAERAVDAAHSESAADVDPAEARAVFAALVDGIFGSFRRLGGPRLAANVEREIDAHLKGAGGRFKVTNGRLTFLADTPETLDGELDIMRDTLKRVDAAMAHLSGATLVDHFYDDALREFSGRMRRLVRVLGFYDR